MGLITWISKGLEKRLIDYTYPVGSIFQSTSPTNPSEYFGGTWEPFAEGRVLIGAGTGNDGTTSMSFTASSEGGKYKHQHQYGLLHGEYYGLVSNTISVLNTNENGDSEWVPTHSASYQAQSTFNSTTSNQRRTINADQYACYVKTGLADNAMPYITAYMWKRVS